MLFHGWDKGSRCNSSLDFSCWFLVFIDLECSLTINVVVKAWQKFQHSNCYVYCVCLCACVWGQKVRHHWIWDLVSKQYFVKCIHVFLFQQCYSSTPVSYTHLMNFTCYKSISLLQSNQSVRPYYPNWLRIFVKSTLHILLYLYRGKLY